MRKHFSIAIDGPAGAGKSTVAKAVAKALGAVYLDTGAMYRTMGLYMSDNGITGPERIASASAKPEVQVRFIGDAQHMVLDGTDVTDRIHTPEASLMASKVSAVPAVRERMVALQREIAQGQSVVMDGRDIGTYVLPDATLKIYLTASCGCAPSAATASSSRRARTNPMRRCSRRSSSAISTTRTAPCRRCARRTTPSGWTPRT